MSNVNATINKTEEIIIIMDETIKESVKKKGQTTFVHPFFILYIVHLKKCTTNS